MNFVKRFLKGRETRIEFRTCKKVENLIIASIRFFFTDKLILISKNIKRRIDTKVLTSSTFWSYCDRGLNMIFSNKLADLLDIELLKL